METAKSRLARLPATTRREVTYLNLSVGVEGINTSQQTLERRCKGGRRRTGCDSERRRLGLADDHPRLQVRRRGREQLCLYPGTCGGRVKRGDLRALRRRSKEEEGRERKTSAKVVARLEEGGDGREAAAGRGRLSCRVLSERRKDRRQQQSGRRSHPSFLPNE